MELIFFRLGKSFSTVLTMMISGMFLFVLFTSCSHKKIEEKIAIKLNEETQPVSDDDLRGRIDDLIVKSNFTEEQKSRLYDVRNELTEKLSENDQTNLKLRSVLFKEILSADYSKKEVDTIGTMIRQNNNKRTFLIKESIEKINNILGHVDPKEQHQRAYDDTVF